MNLIFKPTKKKAKPAKLNFFNASSFPKRSKAEWKVIDKNPFGDKDGDRVPNMFDCKPLNKNKQGIWRKPNEQQMKDYRKLRDAGFPPEIAGRVRGWSGPKVTQFIKGERAWSGGLTSEQAEELRTFEGDPEKIKTYFEEERENTPAFKVHKDKVEKRYSKKKEIYKQRYRDKMEDPIKRKNFMEKAKKWRTENHDKVLESARARRKKDPEKFLEYQRKYRAERKNNEVEDKREEQINEALRD